MMKGVAIMYVRLNLSVRVYSVHAHDYMSVVLRKVLLLEGAIDLAKLHPNTCTCKWSGHRLTDRTPPLAKTGSAPEMTYVYM